MAVKTPGVTFKLTGNKRLDKLFQTLPKRVQKKVLRKPLRDAAKVIHADARQRIPRVTGRFRVSLKVRAGRRSRKLANTVRIVVITSEGWFKGKVYYGAFVEFGHRQGKRIKGTRRKVNPVIDTRKEIPGRHDIKHAFDAKAEQAKGIAMAGIAAGIIREATSAGVTA